MTMPEAALVARPAMPLSERRPTLPGWEEVAGAWKSVGTLAASAWSRTSSGVFVISSLQMAELPSGKGTGPQWHVSVSRLGKRPRDIDVRAALRAFGLVGAEEDNHHPGIARQFWLPVDPRHRVDCECKAEEEVVVEADGYRWTNPRPGEGPCRGCELARAKGTTCSLHPEARP